MPHEENLPAPLADHLPIHLTYAPLEFQGVRDEHKITVSPLSPPDLSYQMNVHEDPAPTTRASLKQSLVKSVEPFAVARADSSRSFDLRTEDVSVTSAEQIPDLLQSADRCDPSATVIDVIVLDEKMNSVEGVDRDGAKSGYTEDTNHSPVSAIEEHNSDVGFLRRNNLSTLQPVCIDPPKSLSALTKSDEAIMTISQLAEISLKKQIDNLFQTCLKKHFPPSSIVVANEDAMGLDSSEHPFLKRDDSEEVVLAKNASQTLISTESMGLCKTFLHSSPNVPGVSLDDDTLSPKPLVFSHSESIYQRASSIEEIGSCTYNQAKPDNILLQSLSSNESTPPAITSPTSLPILLSIIPARLSPDFRECGLTEQKTSPMKAQISTTSSESTVPMSAAEEDVSSSVKAAITTKVKHEHNLSRQPASKRRRCLSPDFLVRVLSPRRAAAVARQGITLGTAVSRFYPILADGNNVRCY